MEEKLLKILEDICGEDMAGRDKDTDLLEEGLLDSMDLVELLVGIEEEFGVTLSPTEYEKEELSTVRRIEEILRGKGIR